MLQFPHSLELKDLQKLTDKILVLSTALGHIPSTQEYKKHVFHHQLLKSSLFSARIEGNSLTLIQAKNVNLKNPKQKSKLEISNVMKALRKLSTFPGQLDQDHILNIHSQILHGLSTSAGRFRSESSAIFDGFGNVVYLTPSPEEMKTMLAVWLKHSGQEKNNIESLQRAAQCHYYFEKIHPFIDGNGRTGRVLLQHQLMQTNLFHGYILPIDEFFDNNKPQYYALLEKNTKNIGDFITFFLEGIIWSLESLLQDIKELATTTQQKPKSIKSHLLPRRQEILNITKDHPYITLDGLSRRFPRTPKRTISYDVNWLCKNNFVRKHGQTRGACYTAIL